MAGEQGGLLAFLNSAAGQGLLGAAAGTLAGNGNARQNIGRGLLGGLGAYNNAQDNQRQDARFAKQDQLFDLNLASMKQQQAQQQQAMERQGQRQSYLGSVGQVTSPVMGAQPNQFNPNKWIGMGGSIEEAKALTGMGNWGKAAVKDYKDVRGADGSVQIVGFDEFGNQVKTGAQPFKAPDVRDFGGYVGGIDPITGKVSNYGAKTMSAADRDASARGWAGIKTQQDANNINKQATRTQVVEGADGSVYLVDKGTGLSRPAATMSGAPIQAGRAAEAKISRTRDANDAVELITMAGDLIPKATGSGIGSAVDAGNRFFGNTTESAQAAARLEALGGALVMKMPRMEGPQSNMDQVLYREMAGKIGDRTVPAAEKAAALETVRALNERYTNKQAPKSGGAKFLGFE